MNQIGTVGERDLHAALKRYLAQPGDEIEVAVDGYVIDIVRGGQLIEIQTRSFGKMKRKLERLLPAHPLHLVHPIAVSRWIVKESRRRKSPRKGSIYDLFSELVALPQLLHDPNFTLQVLFVHDEVVREYDPARRWRRRRGWIAVDRRLLQVVGSFAVTQPADLLQLLPGGLAEPFGTSALAAAIERPRRTAQQMAYCLREMDLIEVVERQGNALLYRRCR